MALGAAPRQTRATSLAFPKEEPKLHSRLTFYKYERPNPSDTEPNFIIEESIRLPLPLSFPDGYSVRISTVDMGNIAGTVMDAYVAAANVMNQPTPGMMSGGFMGQITSAISAGWGVIGGAIPTNIQEMITQTNITDILPYGEQIRAETMARTGLVRNPRTASLFDGVDLRSHTFTFRCSPRNQDEATELRKIIDTIKYKMYPSLNNRGASFNYPSLARLEFFPLEELYVTPVFYSFIKDFTPNYSAVGTPSFYKDGTPVTIEFSLGLQELSIITRETLDDLERQRQQS